ncbi:MAG: hypothetical protein JWM11_6798, partial [Planctomycetaceae bacterium]|nr:hypothetical protein [Planctomycetaceae bacterium]
ARQNVNSNAPLLFHLSGIGLSEPVGPQLRDTTLRPLDASVSVGSQLAFYWLPFNTVSAISSPNVSSRPGSPANLNQNLTSGQPSNFGGSQTPNINGLASALHSDTTSHSAWKGSFSTSLVGYEKVRLSGRSVPMAITPNSMSLIRPPNPDQTAAHGRRHDADFAEFSDESEVVPEAEQLFAQTDSLPVRVPSIDQLPVKVPLAPENIYGKQESTADTTGTPRPDSELATAIVSEAQFYWIAAWSAVVLAWLAARSRYSKHGIQWFRGPFMPNQAKNRR